MINSADPDQLASSEANWSGSTLFAKTGHVVNSKRRVNWPAGHARIVGNEIADQLAKEATIETSKPTEDTEEKLSTNLPEIKEASTKTQHEKWQRRVDSLLYGRVYHSLIPLVQTNRYLDNLLRSTTTS